jgi:hypothetical protein
VGGGNSQFSAWLADESERSDGESSEIVGPLAYNGDQPVDGDFDRDGQVNDVTVFRPSGATWDYDYDHDGDADDTSDPSLSASSYRSFAGNFDQDGYIDDVAVYRYNYGNWYYDDYHNATVEHNRYPPLV